MLTADGEIELSRPYFWARGHAGVFPADALSGIETGRVSRGATEILCRMGMTQDFRQAAEDAKRIGNVPVCSERLRLLVEAQAAAITASRNSGATKAAWTHVDATVEASAKPGSPTRIYAGVDGVMAPIVTQAEKDKRRTNHAMSAASGGRRRDWGIPGRWHRQDRGLMSHTRR